MTPAAIREKETRRITYWGIATNAFLAIIKVVGGILGQSQALLADGIHSFSDLASDAMVLIAAKHANEAADEDHPYGHARYETLATVIMGIILIGVAVGIIYDAYLRLQAPSALVIPALFTFAIAGISILCNEALYHATIRVAKKINSPLLKANAWHHRSDAVSSVVVLIGIGATFAGYPLFDAIAAILVALMIAKIGFELSFSSVQELVDTALEPEMVKNIENSILSIEDVRELHMLRTRRMGHTALVDVHIMVAPRLSVSEGHHIAESVEKLLINTFDEITDVTVHIDPEDDENTASCEHVPLRSEIIKSLKASLNDHQHFRNIEEITLHYLDGKVSIEAFLPLNDAFTIDEMTSLQKEFASLDTTIDCVQDLRLNFR